MGEFGHTGSNENEPGGKPCQRASPVQPQRGEQINDGTHKSEDEQEAALCPAYVEEPTHRGAEARERFLEHMNFEARGGYENRRQDDRRNDRAAATAPGAEERRVGKEWGSRVRSRGWADNKTKRQ